MTKTDAAESGTNREEIRWLKDFPCGGGGIHFRASVRKPEREYARTCGAR